MNGETNGSNGSEQPVPLPSAKPFTISHNISIQAPLTRRGRGPGLIHLVPVGLNLDSSRQTLDPPPLQKWAEEGFAVAQITLTDGEGTQFEGHLREAITGLAKLSECDSTEKIGLISYNAPITQDVSNAIDSTKAIAAIITYGNSHIQTSKPCQCHIAGTPEKGVGKASADISHFKTLNYPDLGPFFVVPSHEDFRSSAAAVAHTRCLTFLKPLTGGPYFDLEAIWEEHTMFEFGERAVEKTMGTMVQEPYVNHTPTMTGGIGRDSLTYFYRHHFIFNNPADTALDLVSRTVGIDRVIDEFVAKMTHDRMVDWLAPGIPPTGKYLEIPFTSVVNIRGDRLYHEHISWDQATLLRQLGLMPEYLPFPYALPDGKLPGEGKRFEYKVPTAGVETARKLVDERAVESNGMFEFEVREVDV